MSFSLIHIGNFSPVNWYFIYLYPIYVFPQFISGVIFSYLAIRYNSIMLPFILHVIINTTPDIIRLLN
ncbi:CPBP family glutamic-type intramembrane protease [Dyadobacter psychrotolerans]|uniref:CPBP family intramembrane metalloprotease n=1 Tax=Dyadobacter psychrotolerans TaxID=2541721 RepID=A0A4R5DFL2_9BACT|nr:CPBP family intramembrane metalloprotease [Dyadobacter psychrotolerans]